MAALTAAQSRFVELEKKKEEFKQFKQDLQDSLEELKKEMGLNGHFQDDDGIVYQVVDPSGKFVYFDKVGYQRTRRVDEKKGSLSMKAAKELGYDLNKK